MTNAPTYLHIKTLRQLTIKSSLNKQKTVESNYFQVSIMIKCNKIHVEYDI